MLELNKIYCMDCLEGMKKLPDESINLIVTDPPYNIDYNYDEYNDFREDYWEWLSECFKEMFRILKPDGSIFIKQHYKNTVKTAVNLESVGFKFNDIIIWKNTEPFGKKNKFACAYQPILFYSKSENYKFYRYAQTIPNEFRSWTPTRDKKLKGQISNLWTDIKFIYVGTVNHPEAILEEGTNRKAHPCQMPLGLAIRPILFCTDENDLVLDPFAGSGTVLVACKQLNRKYIGFEISNDYCNITNKRLEQENIQKFITKG